MAMNYRKLGVPVSIGVGATIDFLAGSVKRAPIWMQKTGLEWLYRASQEPKRLVKRYWKDICIVAPGLLRQYYFLKNTPKLAHNLVKNRITVCKDGICQDGKPRV